MHCLSLTTTLILAAVLAQAETGKVHLIAHRGGSKEADENTMGVFRQSYERGLRRFETDFRLTRDNQLVILHDDSLDRTTTGHGPVEELTAAEVRALRSKKSGEPIPFVGDYLAFFRDKPEVFLEIEMKTGPKLYTEDRLEVYCRLLHDAVKMALRDGTYSFTSFDQRALRIMKRLYPDAPTTYIPSKSDLESVKMAQELKCERLFVRLKVTPPEVVREAKKAGMEVIGWFVMKEEDMTSAQALGVDCVVTGIPSQLLAAGKGRP
jgi:glycerophosphoryl diester phosphodiesterase